MKTSDEKRSYLRMPIPGLKVKYNIVGTEGILIPRLPRPRDAYTMLPENIENIEPIFQLMFERLERIEMKLDYLLRMMSRGGQEKIFKYDSAVIDISGGGLSFTHCQGLSVGDVLELCIYSTAGEITPIFAVGKVCRVEYKDDGKYCLVGVEFSDIYEEDRQLIIRMIFDTERKSRRRVNTDESSSRNP
ncbi:MAG: PilZ domain-containing protein [Thermodesulforhabdaceae bacterium]